MEDEILNEQINGVSVSEYIQHLSDWIKTMREKGWKISILDCKDIPDSITEIAVILSPEP